MLMGKIIKSNPDYRGGTELFHFRYQVFHILKAAAEGGDSVLIDGMYVAEKMRSEHPDLFEILAKTEVTWEFVKPLPPYMFHQHTDKTFRQDLEGNILQIR